MKSIAITFYALCALLISHTHLLAQPSEPSTKAEAEKTETPTKAVVGQPAPNFTLTGTDGSQTTLSDHRGTIVVLEWFNPDCPFVKLAHQSGKLGERATALKKKGVSWLAINSGGQGKQGHGLERNKKAVEEYALGRPVYLDPTGKVGRLYDAKKTPHIYVIDAKGILVYAGALDSSRGAGYDSAPEKDYLALAIQSATDNTPMTPANTPAWGCSVKYPAPAK